MSEAHIGNVNAIKWAPEHDAMLRKMRADKISSSKIGDALNREFRTGYSRNAVIGRCQRLGLCVKAVPKPKKPVPTLAPQPSLQPSPKVKRHTAFRPPAFKADPVTGLRQADVVPLNLLLIELEPDQCRWPYGDGPFTFCGCAIYEGSYCHAHAELSKGRGTASERAAA